MTPPERYSIHVLMSRLFWSSLLAAIAVCADHPSEGDIIERLLLKLHKHGIPMDIATLLVKEEPLNVRNEIATEANHAPVTNTVTMGLLGVEFNPSRAAVKPATALPTNDINYAECYRYLTQGQSEGDQTFTTFTSQYGQDAYMYRNFFLGKTNGFYLDVGANAPKEISNTWFFDKCLGWRGLCVEASSSRASQLREQRSCKVIQTCVWDSNKILQMSNSDPNSFTDHLVAGGPTSVQCRTIDDILAIEGVGHIDFVSLDIESAEPQALRGMDVRRWAPDVFTVETFWLNQTFHQSMFDLGYTIVDFLGPDTVYVRRSTPHVSNPAYMQWGRNDIDSYRNEQQTLRGACFDSVNNPVRSMPFISGAPQNLTQLRVYTIPSSKGVGQM